MKQTLDRIDSRIVTELQKNARLSNKELASTIGLAPSSCLERVRRLTGNGVLRGFHADLDPASLGIELQALIAVQLDQHSRKLVDSFEKHVRKLPETVALYHVAGRNDYLVHVAIRDADHLRNLALDAFSSRNEVARIETSLIFRHERSWVLPDYSGGS